MFTIASTATTPFVRTSPAPLIAAAEQDPSVVAVTAGDTRIDYADLDSWSNRLARVLIDMGAGRRGDVVSVLPASVESVVAMWAVAKTGAALATAEADAVDAVLAGSPVAVGITTRDSRAELSDDIEWLVLDDNTTMVRYMTVSDSPVAMAS